MREDLPTEILSCEIIKTERDTAMNYRIVEVPLIYYEVQDEDGNVAYNDRGDNLFDTKEEAEDLIEDLKLDERIEAIKRKQRN